MGKQINLNVVAHELKDDRKYLLVIKKDELSADDVHDLLRTLTKQGIKGLAVMVENPDGVRVEVVA